MPLLPHSSVIVIWESAHLEAVEEAIQSYLGSCYIRLGIFMDMIEWAQANLIPLEVILFFFS